MTISVAWKGTGRQFTADIGTDTVTIVKYRGAGGTPSAAAADGAKEGATALTVTVNKTGICLFVAVPTALDFTGTELDQLIYVWGNFLAAGILATQGDVDGGFGICLSSGAPTTSNYSLFSFYGSDNYEGGWKRMVLDPTKTRSAGAGTLTTSNITHIGVFANVGTTTARFDNLLLDACDVGTGLKITGSTTLGLIEELLANEAINAYGVVTSLNDSDTASELAGILTLGDNSGVLATTIADEDAKLFAAEPLYYNTSSVAAAPLTYAGIDIVGNGTGDTSVIIGKAVGTDKGRNGWSIVGNPTYDVGLDRDDGAVETADFYGTTLENLTGVLSLDGTHDFNSCTTVGCGAISAASSIKNLTSVGSGQLTLSGAAQLIDSLLINNTAASTLVISDLSDVSADSFTSDGSNYAVDLGTIVASETQGWDSFVSGYVSGSSGTNVGVTPTGNEAILVSVASSQKLTINVADGADIPSVANSGAGTVDVVAGLKTFQYTVSPIPSPDYERRLYTVTAIGSLAGAVEIDGEENETGATHTYQHSYANQPVAVQIISNDYVEEIRYETLSASDKTITIDLKVDTND